jgi:hypothetical protein
MEALLYRKQRHPSGLESSQYVINEEFMAVLDLLVYSSSSAHIDHLRAQHDWYVQRVAVYRHFNGQDGRRSWRAELLTCLNNWMRRFPDCVKSGRETRNRLAAAPSAADEVDQVARTLPAGML